MFFSIYQMAAGVILLSSMIFSEPELSDGDTLLLVMDAIAHCNEQSLSSEEDYNNCVNTYVGDGMKVYIEKVEEDL